MAGAVAAVAAAGILFTAALPGWAAPPPAAKADAGQLKFALAASQRRVDLLRDEIRRIDDRIESRLGVIIDTLTAVGDSPESGTKVARMKEETGQRLRKTIDYYAQKRAALQEELRQPRLRLTDEEKHKLIALFDARIEKRTRQILALHQSMPSAASPGRPAAVDARGRDRAGGERSKVEEQRQRMASHSNTQRDAIIKELDRSIDRLERQNRDLQARLSGGAATADPGGRAAVTAEIAKTDALLAERRQQRLATLTAAGRATRAVGGREATDLDTTLQRATDELRQDFTTLFQRYNTCLTEVSNLHDLEAELAGAAAAAAR